MQRESKVGTVPLPRAEDMDIFDQDDDESSNSSSDSGIDASEPYQPVWRSEREQEIIRQYRDILDMEQYGDDDEEEDDEQQEEEAYKKDMHDLNDYYAKLVAEGQFADMDDDQADILPAFLRPQRTASQEEEEEINNAVLNDPEVLMNTMKNTHPVVSPRGAADAARRKAEKRAQNAEKNRVHFVNGSPVASSRDSEESPEGGSEPPPAWEMPVSPMDKTFRSRIGGPLGTALQRPAELASSDEEQEQSSSTGTGDSDGSEHEPYFGGRVANFAEGGSRDSDDSDNSGGSDDIEDDIGYELYDDEEGDADMRRFLQLERAIFTVISPYMTSSPSGKGSGPGPVVFSRELLRSISRTAVQFILPNASAALSARSSEGVYSVLRMFEGAEISDSYRLLMDLLKSVLEELLSAEDNLDSSRNPPVVGYSKAGIPKSLSAKISKHKAEESERDGQGAPLGGTDDEIPQEWTHPLIADLLRQNPSLRAYVKSRTDAEARAAGFERPSDAAKRPAPAVAGKMYVLSSSSSSATSDADSTSSVCTPNELSDDDDEDGGADPMTKLMNTSMASTDINTASPKRSPKKRGAEAFPVPGAESTVAVGPAAPRGSPLRQPVLRSPTSTPPRSSPMRVIKDAAETASAALSAGDYSDEEVLNEFQQRVASSPLVNRTSSAADPTGAMDATKTSPKLKAEERRRRKHSNVRHDDSSSADEETRKELHKNAPYDDSSSAGEDRESERVRRSRHSNLSYDDSTSAGNRSEEERRKQKHMNVPYDDSSSAGEATDEEVRRIKHKNVPYDDSSAADGGMDGSDESVESEGLIAAAALTNAANDWDRGNEEEMIRRKYRSEPKGSASKKPSDAEEERRFVAEDDDDYDFASAVVKYWDQLLGPADAEAAKEQSVEDARRASMVTMQSFGTAAAVGLPPTPSTESSGRSPEALREATFEEFQGMSAEQRTQYLYGSIDQSLGSEAIDRDLNMVQSDLHLWNEMERNSASQDEEDITGKTTTQRDYATLRSEIFELAKMLGVSPSEVLLNGGTAARPLSTAGARPLSAPSSERAKRKSSAEKPKPNQPDEDFGDDVLAGFLNGLNLSGADLRVSASRTNLFGSSTSKGKKKKTATGTKAKASSKSTKSSKAPSAGSKPKSKAPKKTCPPSPSLLRPTTSFSKSKASGQTKKKAKAASSAAVSKAASDRGKRRVRGMSKNDSFAFAEEFGGPAPAGSVNFVSIKRRSKDAAHPEPVPVAEKAAPASPALYLQSPSGKAPRVASSRPASAPPKRMTRRVSSGNSNLNDTDIVVVNNTPIFPQKNLVRPSSAPPGRRNPTRAVSPVLRGGRRSSAGAPVAQSLHTQSLSKARPRSARPLSSSLNAPTMASIHRTNEVLTRALEFMSAPRPKQPWDSYRASKKAWTGAGDSSLKKKKK